MGGYPTYAIVMLLQKNPFNSLSLSCSSVKMRGLHTMTSNVPSSSETVILGDLLNFLTRLISSLVDRTLSEKSSLPTYMLFNLTVLDTYLGTKRLMVRTKTLL